MLARFWWAAVRFGFRLLYNEMARTYDFVSWVVSLGEWRRWQRTALGFLNVPEGACLLELAHGTGNLQIDLRTAGLTSVGIDLSAEMGRIARRKLLRQRIAPELVRGTAQALPFPSGSFPAVVSTFPTEFIMDPVTIHEIWRVLAPGGHLVVVASGVLTWGGAARAALEWAYRLTGQRGPLPAEPLESYRAAGLVVQQETVEHRRSETLVFVAHKP